MRAASAAILAAGLAPAQSTQRVSVDSAGVQGNGASQESAISADGRFVGFVSSASNLVPGDTNGTCDIFLFDRLTSTLERVSVDSAGVQGNGGSGLGTAGTFIPPSISADGRYVVFDSVATNLVAGDTNGVRDVFLRDRLNGTTERVSVDSAGAQVNARSRRPSISDDGRYVVFLSDASTFVAGDTNGFGDVFVRDRLNGTTECMSLNPLGSTGNGVSGQNAAASISGDGRFVAFESDASDLVPGDTNAQWDIFVHDRQHSLTELVSVSSAGVQGAGNSSFTTSISFDGRFIAFQSEAPNLVAGDTNVAVDIFVRDRQLRTTERVNLDSGGGQANVVSHGSSLSGDGRFVAFSANSSNLVPGDTNGWWDIFVRDRQSSTTERVSVDSSGGQANWGGTLPAISADGRFVAFESEATTLVAGDTNGYLDVFVRDRGVPPVTAFCAGDGSAGACPCGNNGAAARGCENSASTGGALLTAAGGPSLAGDTLVLTSSGELPFVLSIFLQGNVSIAAAVFGDGLRCTGGSLKRLYTHNAVLGVVSAPQPGELPVAARSAALGDTIVAGATRYYQTYYRDPVLGFCANPPGNSWNVSSGLSVVWTQ